MKFLKEYKRIELPFPVSEILKLKIKDNLILILLKCGTFYIFNENLQVQKKIKIKIPKRNNKYSQKYSDTLSSLVDFTNELFVVSIDDEVLIYDLLKAKRILSIKPNRSYIFKTNDVSNVVVNQNSVIIGTELGRLVSYGVNGKINAVYPRFIDSIEYTCIGDKYLIFGSYDSRYKIIDKISGNVIIESIFQKIPITYIKEIDAQTVLFGFKNGTIIFLDIPTQNTTTYNLVKNPIKHIELINDNIFIFEQARTSSSVFNLKTRKPQFNIFEDSIYFYSKLGQNFLIFSNTFIKVYTKKDIMHQLILKLNSKKDIQDNLKELSFHLNHNYLLPQLSKLKKQLLKMIEEDKEKATKLLTINHKDTAETLLLKYKYVSEMKEYIKGFLDNADSYILFKKSFDNKNYHVCYEMSKKTEFLKYTKEFLYMEGLFKKLFARIYLNPKLGSDLEKVKAILQPFLSVFEKRNQVNYILKKSEYLHKLAVLIKNNNYQLVFTFVEKNDFLKDLDIYKELMSQMSYRFDNILKAKDIESELNMLKFVPEYKEEVALLQKKYKEFLIFKDKINNGRTLDKFPLENKFILNSEEFRNTIKPFEKVIIKLRSNIQKISKQHIIKFTEDFKGLYFDKARINILIEIYRSDISKFIELNQDKKGFEKSLEIILNKYILLIGEDQFIKDIKLSFDMITKLDYSKPTLLNIENLNFEDMPLKLFQLKK